MKIRRKPLPLPPKLKDFPQLEPLASGHFRYAYLHKGYVIKVPRNKRGQQDNELESSLYASSDHGQSGEFRFARCRLTARGWLVMERVDPIEDGDYPFPDWAKKIDWKQVGFDRNGRLAAYDYAIIKEKKTSTGASSMIEPSKEPIYDFYTRLAQALNSGQSRSVVLYGNVGDLFLINDGKGPVKYIPLVQYLNRKWAAMKTVTQITVELNGPLTFFKPDTQTEDTILNLKKAWRAWKFRLLSMSAAEADREFDDNVKNSASQPAFALEFLRQVCVAVRNLRHTNPEYNLRLLILVESAELAIPAGNGDIAQLQPLDRRKIAILEDWFGDPEFYEGSDSVVLISQSLSQIHPRITQMPQVFDIEVPAPNVEQRAHFVYWRWHDCAEEIEKKGGTPPPWNFESIAKNTAGLTLQSLRQLLIETAYRFPDQDVPTDLIINRVEDFIKSQLGEDVVEFKKPTHTLEDVIGFRSLKTFIKDRLIPRIRRGGTGALSAMGVAGPIGVGKTFIFEAMATELDEPVLVLKNIRSKWFGETDIIFEKLRRVLEAIGSCLVFVDEADTQFGGLSSDTHETERRLTGKVQAMVSDPRLKGRVVWLLMTARIEKLSPDMRRRGRAGDLIIPILDPKFQQNGLPSDDFEDFVWWIVGGIGLDPATCDKFAFLRICEAMKGRSAGDFASIRAEAIAEKVKDIDGLLKLIDDILETDIAKTRRYQELQALLNCTHKSLIPDISDPRRRREEWQQEVRVLQEQGYGR